MKTGRRTDQLVREHNRFLHEQLMETQQSLFAARSVKEIRFLQSKINYLKQRLNQVSGMG